MSDAIPPGAAEIRWAPDAAATWPAGTLPEVKHVPHGTAAVSNVPVGVTNWDYYDGAIVIVADFKDGVWTNRGSGVMVAPGFVLTATHVVHDVADDIGSQRRTLWCIAIRENGTADAWLVSAMRFPETESDITFLGVEPHTKTPPGWTVSCFPLSTRAPRVGESVTVLGFVVTSPDASADTLNGAPVLGQGHLYIAIGSVAKLHHHLRDRFLAPYPVIEIESGSIGGMSGGAVLDAQGDLIGLLSTGTNIDDGQGPSNAAWIIEALRFTVTLPWPPKVYAPNTPLLDLPDDVLKIVGREHMTLLAPGDITYSLWH